MEGRNGATGAQDLFSFPHPVDEVSARLVATGVVLQCVGILITGWTVLLAVLAWGFVARVATGPTLSPLGTLVTRVVRPRLALAARDTPGPPKRFAQGIGATLSVGALVATALGAGPVAVALVAAILVAASLEAFVGFCLGCWMFRLLMRIGLIPEETCEACRDIWGTR
ncbi:MAG: DUF4395 domain-containing protein [Actinobacteria bacterium]|nr:DUF4395 domain-containing protein [Actinomycetota bacterium]